VNRRYRRKVINPPAGHRNQLDRYEQRTQDLISDVFKEFEELLTADTDRRARAEIAHLEGWMRGGEPGA
jgi:hypothetical protein